jgi:hypothetical protein
MSSETLTVACAVTIFLVAVFGLVYYALDRSRVRESAAYERVFAVLMQDGRDLRDRMYVAKGQPPTGTDVRKNYAEAEARREMKRTAEQQRPRQSGPVDTALAELEADELTGAGARE